MAGLKAEVDWVVVAMEGVEEALWVVVATLEAVKGVEREEVCTVVAVEGEREEASSAAEPGVERVAWAVAPPQLKPVPARTARAAASSRLSWRRVCWPMRR